jgi:hypothetical protein
MLWLLVALGLAGMILLDGMVLAVALGVIVLQLSVSPLVVAVRPRVRLC